MPTCVRVVRKSEYRGTMCLYGSWRSCRALPLRFSASFDMHGRGSAMASGADGIPGCGDEMGVDIVGDACLADGVEQDQAQLPVLCFFVEAHGRG